MRQPKVSILLPVYNAEEFLSETLVSLQEQTHHDFEVIAIDDGSLDGSLQILEGVAEKDPRFKVTRQKNMGLVATLNRGLSLASSEIIARADSDDVYHPDRLRLQLEYFCQRGDLSLLGAQSVRIDERGRLLYRESQPEGHDEILKSLMGGYGGVVPHPAAVYRRDDVLELGGYDESAKHCEDLDLWLKLSQRGRLANLPRRLVKYRVQDRSVSSQHWREQASNAQRVCERWHEKTGAPLSKNPIWARLAAPDQSGLLVYRARQSAGQGLHWAATRTLWSVIASGHRSPYLLKFLVRSALKSVATAHRRTAGSW